MKPTIEALVSMETHSRGVMVGWLFDDKYVQVSDAVLDKGSSWLRTRHLPAQVEAWDRLALKFFYDRMVECGSPVYLDIGANLGIFTLLSVHVPGSHCIAFEPNPTMAGILADSLGLNPELGQQSEVVVHVMALGAGTRRKAHLHVLPAQTGLARIDQGFTDRTDEIVIDVDVDALDNVVGDLPALDLIKIDVEGMELDVIKGGEHTIRKFMPGILLEWWPPHTEHYGYHPSEIDALLASWGYKDREEVTATDVFYTGRNNA